MVLEADKGHYASGSTEQFVNGGMLCSPCTVPLCEAQRRGEGVYRIGDCK